MQTLDGRHLLSLLGRFETVGQQDHATADADQVSGKDAGDQGGPGADEFGQVQGGRVKEVEEARVAPGPQPVTAHQAADASQVGADRPGGEHDGQPEESAGAGGAYGGGGLIPDDPEVPGWKSDFGLDISDSRIMISDMNATTSVQKSEQRIPQIKAELAALGDMRPGSLSQQYNVCGKPNCRCKDPQNPQRHGPYYQLSWVHRGKSTTQFIRPALLPQVRAQIATYTRFRKLTDQWVNLALRLAQAKLLAARRSLSK